MYKCPNKECAIHQRDKEIPIFMSCPLCDTLLESQRVLTPFQQKIKNTYPYVIAYPFTRMIEEPFGRNQLELLAFTLMNVLKYLGLITASEYYHSPIKSNHLNELFKNNLFQPSIGNWNQFIREAIKELNAQHHNWVFPELVDVYVNVESGENCKKYKSETEYTNEQGEISWLESKDTAIGTLINFRNKYLGHGAPLTIDEYENLFLKYYPILEDLLNAINPLLSIRMYKSDLQNTYELIGLSFNKLIKQEGISEDKIWIESEGRKLNLLPFYVMPGKFANVKDNPQIFVYEQNTSARLVFFSPESKKVESQGEVFNWLKELINEKEKESPLNANDINKDKINQRINIHNHKIRNGLIKEKKIIVGVYQNRVFEETILLNWIKTPYGLLFINADAGSGKTNLLDYINSQYNEIGVASLFIRANHLKNEPLEDLIKKILNIELSVDLLDVFKYYSEENPFVIVVDGGNEHPNSELFLNQINSFLKTYSGGIVKFILSWRSANDFKFPDLPEIEKSIYKPAKQHYFPVQNNTINKEDKGNAADSIVFNTMDQGNDKEHPLVQNALSLSALNRIELESAWNNYISYKDEKNKKLFSPQFSIEDIEKNDLPLFNQLYNPLLLRLFLEYFNNKSLKHKNEGFAEIWELWWKGLSKNKKHTDFLSNLALFLAEKDALSIELDELYNHKLLGKEFQNIQSDSTYKKLLDNSELSSFFKDDHLMIGFTMEGKFYYVLSQILNQQEVDLDKIIQLLGQGSKWKEAIKYYLSHQIKIKKYVLLFELIDNKEIDEQLLIKPLAQALLTEDIDMVLDGLLKNPTDRDWDVLSSTIRYIDSANKHDILKSIASKIFNKSIKFEPFNIRIGLVLYEFINSNQRLIFKDKIIISDTNEKNNKSLKDLYLLGQANFCIIRMDAALEYYKLYEEKIIKEPEYNDFELARLYHGIGACLQNLNNLKEGYNYYKKAESIYKKEVNENANHLILLYLNYCNIASHLDENINLDEILSQKSENITFAVNLFNKYIGTNDDLWIKILYTKGLLELEINSDESVNAIKYIKEAIELSKEIYGKDADLAWLYGFIGENSRNKKEALKYYRLYIKRERKITNKQVWYVKEQYFTFRNYFWARGVFLTGLYYGCIHLFLSYFKSDFFKNNGFF